MRIFLIETISLDLILKILCKNHKLQLTLKNNWM